MKRFSLKTFSLALALTVGISSAAMAASLKSEGAIAGASVTVGDVFDGVAAADAARYLAPLPASGDLVLKTKDLQRISDAFHLGWVAQGQESLVLHAEKNEADKFAIEAALQESISAEMKDRKFDMEITTQDARLSLPKNGDKTLAVKHLKLDVVKGSFSATVAAGDNTREIYGKVYPLASIPVLKSAVAAGETISVNDVDYVDMRTADISASVQTDAAKIIGQSPRRTLGGMKPINAAELTAPMLVKKGQLVTMVLENEVLHLTVQGKALDNGTAGDVVRIVNTASNQTVQGVVSAAQTVTVQSPATIQTN